MKNNKQFNKDFLRLVVGRVNTTCTNAFGAICTFRENLLVDQIIEGNKLSSDTKSSLGWSNLVNIVNDLPIGDRQELIIDIVADIHDYQMATISEPIGVAQMCYCTHWWLIGADEMRRIAELPEVYIVLSSLRAIKNNENSRICASAPSRTVNGQANTLEYGFRDKYNQMSQIIQKKRGVCQDNLEEKLLQGKDFYRQIPLQVLAGLSQEPILAKRMTRDICDNVPVIETLDQAS